MGAEEGRTRWAHKVIGNRVVENEKAAKLSSLIMVIKYAVKLSCTNIFYQLSYYLMSSKPDRL